MKATWKGSVQIGDINYYWEQSKNEQTQEVSVHIYAPLCFSFEFNPQQQSLGEALVNTLKSSNSLIKICN